MKVFLTESAARRFKFGVQVTKWRQLKENRLGEHHPDIGSWSNTIRCQDGALTCHIFVFHSLLNANTMRLKGEFSSQTCGLI